MNSKAIDKQHVLAAVESSSQDSEMMAAAQLIFAEKRTALALMRTGISVIALPLAVASALIATSKFYDATSILHLFIPVMVINVALAILGIYLVTRSIIKLRHEEKMLTQLKANHPPLAAYFD